MNDQDIIQHMKHKPDKGIYEAIEKYEGLLTHIASKILSNSQDVEECVSDAFLDTWKQAGNLSAEKGSLKGYLVCTVRNKAINRYHRNQRNQSVSSATGWTELASSEELENQVFLSEDTHQLMELISGLGEPEREILLRKCFLFESVNEIAQQLHLQPNQVKYKLQRTRAQLREALTQRGIAL